MNGLMVRFLTWNLQGILRPADTTMTAFRPDIMVVNRPALTAEPLWREQSILTQERSILWVAEVVSRNWQNHYARKLADYGVLGIPEYWIVDYAGLGGVRHMGKPKQPTLSICTLVRGEYEIQQFRDNQVIFPHRFRLVHDRALEKTVLKTGRSNLASVIYCFCS